MDIQKMMDLLSKTARSGRSQYHLTLGQLIDDLKTYPKDSQVVADHYEFAPGKLTSYRGYYEDLAFQPSRESGVTVDDVLADCLAALGTEFTGYKGGEFMMGEDTPLWVAEYGDASGIAVVGVHRVGDAVILKTKIVD